MVRFHWPVEGGHSAWVPSGGMKLDEAAGVRHITLDMELAGQNETVMSLMTVPADYLDTARMSPVGLVLAHGGDADDWRAPLLEQLAARFAAAGHVVMRYFCPLKEQRRHRILEKAFEVARTSPYAAAVTKWVFVGYDNGARIAAGVGGKVASWATVSGFVFLSYPLLDPAPPPPKQKAGAVPPADSVGALTKLDELTCPMLFVCGEFDRLCPGPKLKDVLAEGLPDVDARVLVLEGLSGRFCEPGTKALEYSTLDTVLQHVQTFVAAVAEGSLGTCPLPKAADLEPSTRPLPDVPESPKREASPEESEPEPEPEPPARLAPRGARGGATRPAAQQAQAAGMQQQQQLQQRQGIPAGMVPVMGPHGQPMLVPAAMAGNPAAQQQLLLMQQQMLAAHMQKQQQAGAGGGGGAVAALQQQQAMQQQQMQFQMAMLAQHMAAAQRPPSAAAAAAMQQAQVQAAQQQAAQQQLLIQQHMQQQLQLLQQQQQAAQQQQQQQAAPMAVDHPAAPQQ